MKSENKVYISKLLSHNYLDFCLLNKEATFAFSRKFCIFQLLVIGTDSLIPSPRENTKAGWSMLPRES